MSDFNVSTRYAKALLAIATETNQFNEVATDIDLVYNTFVQNKELKVAVISPVIKQEKKIQIIDAVFKGKITEKTLEFLLFVLKKNREAILLSILKRYVDLKNKKLGLADVKVKVAFEVSDAQKDKLKLKLESVLNKKVTVTYNIDDSIIGGFIARDDDTVYDASIRHSLDLLKKKFIQGEIVLN